MVGLWLETAPGVSFLELGAWTIEDGELVEHPEQPDPGFHFANPVEDAAEACASWFLIREDLRNFYPIRYEWAQLWLPE